jgi:hypothetical protein
MNWDAISAIGEVVGAAAVIVTLLFVARDIRQNSKSLAISALRDTTSQWNQWSDMIASSGDLAVVVAKGNKAYADLSESEKLRYGAYIQSFFDNAESYRVLVTDYKAEKDLTVLTSIVSRRIAIPGFSAWWRENTADYSAEFVVWIEGLRGDT